MVKHIIIWEFKEGFSTEENRANAEKIKAGLEGLKGRISGLTDARVQIDLLSSSTGNIMLDCTFENEESLKSYQVNPEHLKVASLVRTVTQNRSCVDFEE
jgi:hypothetical protein